MCNGCGYASRPARSASSTATTSTAGPASARCATTGWRTASSRRARRRARPTRSSSGLTRSSSRSPSGGWPTLHRRGEEGAYLYGAGDEPEHDLAGGLGAFFLLTEPPERFGLPAEAESPVQENVVRRDGRGRRRRAARGGRRRGGVRDRAEAPVSGDDDARRGTSRRRSARGASRPRGGGRPRARTWPSRGPRGATRRWSFLYGPDTRYGDVEPEDGRGRGGEPPDARRRRCPAICAGRSSSRRCGPGRFRSTSGSAAWPRGRRSSRWPPISRATSGRPPSRARSRSPRCCRRRRC